MSALAHSGMGVPQYLFLEMFQSLAFFNHMPNLFSPTVAGTHLVFSLSATSLSDMSATRTNQTGTAR